MPSTIISMRPPSMPAFASSHVAKRTSVPASFESAWQVAHPASRMVGLRPVSLVPKNRSLPTAAKGEYSPVTGSRFGLSGTGIFLW